MRRRSRPTAPPDGPLAPALRRRFPDGLAAPEPEEPPPPPPPTWTEAEVMAAAFAALAGGAELDLRGVRIVTARPPRPPATATVGAAQKLPVPEDRRARPASGSPRATPVPEDRSEAAVPEDRCALPPDAPGSLRAAAAALRGRPWQGPGWRDSPGHGAGPTDAAQRDVLARARHHSVPTLTIRGQRREPAIAAVAAFVGLHRAAGRRYVRVVTGKGLGSAGDPVLKLALDEWCRGAGEPEVSAWAPERDRDGDYGAVVLRLRPRVP